MFSNLMTNLNKYKYAIICGIVAIACMVVTALYIKELRAQNIALSQKLSTMISQFEKVGDAYQAQGLTYATDKAAWEEARKQLGSAIADSMQKSDAQIRVLYDVLASLKSEHKDGQPTTVTPTATGAFKNVTLVQQRTGPSLTEVSLSYDPANPSATRLTSSWFSYQENFDFSLGEWKKKDTGYVAGVRVKRQVLRPDEKGNLVVVGIEEVPLTSATATFGPAAFGGEQAVTPVPRFSVYGGGGWDSDKKKAVPVLGMDYRLTPNMGIGAGIAGNTVFGSMSYRFGK